MVRWLVVRVTSIASLLQRCLLVRYPLEQNGPKLLFHSDGGSSGNVTRTIKYQQTPRFVFFPSCLFSSSFSSSSSLSLSVYAYDLSLTVLR